MSASMWPLAGCAVLFLIGFLACFRPIRKVFLAVMRVVLAGTSLILCNALGLPLGINLFSILFVAILGIPGLCTLCAVYALV